MRRIILLGWACGLLVGSVGCAPVCALLCPGAMCNDPYAPATRSPAGCGSEFGESCGPAVAAGPVCTAPCDAACPRRGPLDLVFALFRGDAWCGSSCGEPYFGDYCSEPPDCCEPCDQYGNYVGNGTGGANMQGYAPATMPAPMAVEPTPAIRQSSRQPVRR